MNTLLWCVTPLAAYGGLVAAYFWLGKSQSRWAHAAFTAAAVVALGWPTVVIALLGRRP
jgi:ABC-type uncharacterized transport system permease subunit